MKTFQMKLLIHALAKFACGVFLVGALLFLPAGTLGYRNAWLFMGVLFLPMLVLGAVLLVRDPKLLKQRLDTKEKEDTQKGVVVLSGVLFFCGFLLAGLDFRFGWSHVPTWLVIVATAILLITYALYAEVMRENAYLSRVVQVQEGQRVVDTGLYAVVRHPMYAVTLWMFLAIPLILGSWFALICFLHYPVILIVRIRNEEKLLTEGLLGYREYQKKVKYRLIPFVW